MLSTGFEPSQVVLKVFPVPRALKSPRVVFVGCGWKISILFIIMFLFLMILLNVIKLGFKLQGLHLKKLSNTE